MLVGVAGGDALLLTDDHVRSELKCDWHDYLLKRKEIVCILHAFLGPRDVHGAVILVNTQAQGYAL